MPDKYVTLPPRYRVDVIPEAVIFQDGEEYVVLEGAVVAYVVRCLLDGERAFEEIICQLERAFPEADGRALLEQMEQGVCLSDSPVSCEFLGTMELAKKFGAQPVYHIHR